MDETEAKIIAAIDANREKLLQFAHQVAAHAEPGFFEFKTAEETEKMLESCGLSVETGLAGTGVRGLLHGGEAGPRVSVIGELDGIGCPAHPQANPENGIAHACGHNAQLTAVVGAAMALTVPEVAQKLWGTVEFFAVPAEEYVPIRVREQVKQERGIQFSSGKMELIRTGEFEKTDIALTTHVHMAPSEKDLLLGNVACNGCVSKTVIFHGKAAHAAAAPHAGVNALNAAGLALSAIGLLRETFKESDTVRIHTNILQGGTVLNVVPDTVVMEAMVRACTLEALDDASAKFDNACIHSALALGATVEIQSHAGYMPVRPSQANPATIAAAGALGGKYSIEYTEPHMKNTACTDVGDLTHLLPVVNFTHGGVTGDLHSANFAVVNEDTAYIMPAKMMALSVYHLLKDGAKLAKETINNFTPVFDRESYTEKIRRQG